MDDSYWSYFQKEKSVIVFVSIHTAALRSVIELRRVREDETKRERVFIFILWILPGYCE